MDTYEKRKVIMIVDDSTAYLKMGKEILKDKYITYTLLSAKTMFAMLQFIQPDMILLDIEMPDMNGIEALRELKAEEAYAEIPVIFMTTNPTKNNEIRAFELGVVDYIFKPFSPPLMLKRIESHLTLA